MEFSREARLPQGEPRRLRPGGELGTDGALRLRDSGGHGARLTAGRRRSPRGLREGRVGSATGGIRRRNDSEPPESGNVGGRGKSRQAPPPGGRRPQRNSFLWNEFSIAFLDPCGS